MLTFVISAPAAVALYVFAPLASRLIFSSLGEGEKELLVRLVRIMAVNAVSLSLVQTSSACLTSLGSPIKSTVTQWISAVLRVAVTAVLIAFTSLSISGAAISANCSYLVAGLINFWYIIRYKKKKSREDGSENNVDRIRYARGRLDEKG